MMERETARSGAGQGADQRGGMDPVKLSQNRIEDGRRLIIVSANSFWNIKNFRTGLIDSLIDRGWEIMIAAPDIDEVWARRRRAKTNDIKVDRSGMNPFKDLPLIVRYFWLMKSHQPKFFLGFTAKPNIYGPIAARFSRVICLPNISGLGTAFINPGPLSALVGVLYRLALAQVPDRLFPESRRP